LRSKDQRSRSLGTKM